MAGRHPLLQEIEIYRVGVRSLDKPRAIELSAEILTTDSEAIVNDPAVDIVVEVYRWTRTSAIADSQSLEIMEST